MRKFSPQIYDFVIVSMTSVWYKEVLTRLPKGARILDVGIGTGTSLCKNATLVLEKEITVVGIDIDQAYIKHCRKALKDAGLDERCSAVCKSVFDEDLADEVGSDFDAIYFSGSISLMPEPEKALALCSALTKGGKGKIYVTQTFQKKDFPFLAFLKPLLKYLTTIDFGKLTFEKEVEGIIERSGKKLMEKSQIKESVDNAYQAAYILIVQ